MLRASHKQQHSCGATWVDLMDAPALQASFPWLNTAGDSEGGGGAVSLGSGSKRNEGYFDPWALLQAMKTRAASLGVQYLAGEAVDADVSYANNRYTVDSVTVRGELVPGSGSGTAGGAGVSRLRAHRVVNAAGAFAGMFVDMLAAAAARRNTHTSSITPLPVEPRKRCIFVLDCLPPGDFPWAIPPRSTPLVVDTSGVWFRPEGQCIPCTTHTFIAGVSPPADQDPACTGVDALAGVDYSLYDSLVWPALARRVPAFEYLRLKSAWAGFYEYNTLDQVSVGE